MAYPRSEANISRSIGKALADVMSEQSKKKEKNLNRRSTKRIRVVNTSKINSVSTLSSHHWLATFPRVHQHIEKISTCWQSCWIQIKKFALFCLSMKAKSEVKITVNTWSKDRAEDRVCIHQNEDGSESDGVDSNCRVYTVPVYRIRHFDPDPWIRSLDYGSESCSFCQRLSWCQLKIISLKRFFAYF